MRPILMACCLISIVFTSHSQSRKIIRIPDIPGYRTLKCDFHTHTIFSDGTVWPTVRIEEAWREGLDALSITDHIEYRPHSKDVESDHNRSYEIAEPLARTLNVLLIRGAEITRNMPPGHFNALFIKNANLLDREDVYDALREARDQGAFLVWNHPGWKVQQPDSTLWWDAHSQLLNSNLMHGIEVYNFKENYPEAMDWAREKRMTVLANTDIHGPVGMEYDLNVSHRPMTLVFSKSRTEGGIKEALFSRRTIAYYENTLVGRAGLLEALFFSSLQITPSPGILSNGESRRVEITNRSDIDFELELVQPGIGFDATSSLLAKAHKVTVLELSGNSDEVSSMKVLNAYYKVKNMKLSSSDDLVVTISIPNIE